MNDHPQEPAAPPPPSPAPSTTDDKAGGGLRALAVLLSLVLAFGAAVMIVAAGEISDTVPCDEGSAAIEASGQTNDAGQLECFDGSSTVKSVVVGLMYASGAVGAVAVLLALAFTITGRRGRLSAQVAITAVVLAGLSLLISAL